MTARRVSGGLAAVDYLLVALLALAALSFWVIALTQTAGPFGAAAWPALLALTAALPLVVGRLVGLAMRRRAPGRSGAAALGVAVVMDAGFGAIPAVGWVAERRAHHQENRMIDLLAERAASCSSAAVPEVPDEVETNPGVSVRPRYTELVVRCIEELPSDWSIQCNVTGCQASPAYDTGQEIVLVDLRGFMDEALRAAGSGAWNRRPQRGDGIPPPPWVHRASQPVG